MPNTTTDDGVRLHWEESGAGFPILFVHEFAGDHRSFEPQVRHFEDRYRCIVYAARGYPPSDVPEDESAYSQERAVADAISVLDAAGAERAHVVGVSMGGFCSLHLGRRHPERAASIVVAGAGYGAQPEARARFRAECEAIAAAFRDEGSAAVAERYAVGPARVQFQNKNRSGWELFASRLAEHNARGATLTMLGVQRLRPSLYDLRDELARMTVPTLIVAGDEDEGCLEPDLMLKRTIASSGLAILPRTGHTCNLEEPEIFNATVERFLQAVEDGRWGLRDPRSLSASVTGMDEQAAEPAS
jgi:pimeloyl-ACP methyl ester carboxylesterase